MSKDFYSVLEVARDADQAELKRAYRRQARQHHPDRNDGDDARFKEVKKAYDFLSDESKRAQYDRLLELKESGQLDEMLTQARFEKVPFVPVAGDEPEPVPERSTRHPGQVPYPTVPQDAPLHPGIAGWWVPMPPRGDVGFLPNPYYDPVVAQVRRGRQANSVISELLDLMTRRRWRR